MVSPIFASHSLKASFKLYDGLRQCKHLLGTLLASLYFEYSVLNPALVTVLDRVYSGTLDLQKLLPDITAGATIGIHRFSVYMKYNILETCVSAVVKESCVTLHHLSWKLGRSRTIIWSPFRRTISPTFWK